MYLSWNIIAMTFLQAMLPTERLQRSCFSLVNFIITLVLLFVKESKEINCENLFIYLNINQLDAINFIMSLFHASTCFEHMCSSSGDQNCTIQLLVSSHLQVYHHTWRCDDTRGCVVQFWPPDDEHMCSEHVEAWNKLIIKFSASSWLILR